MNLRALIKPLFKIDTHMDLVPQTALILKHDGKEDIYNFLQLIVEVRGKTGLALLSEGAGDADKPFSGGYINTFQHFHHPWSHRGYLTGKPAGLRGFMPWRAISGKRDKELQLYTTSGGRFTCCRTYLFPSIPG